METLNSHRTFEEEIISRYSNEQLVEFANFGRAVAEKFNAMTERESLSIRNACRKRLGMSLPTLQRIMKGVPVSKAAYSSLTKVGVDPEWIKRVEAWGLNGSVGHKRESGPQFVCTSSIPNRLKVIDFILKTGAIYTELEDGIGVNDGNLRNYLYGRRMATEACKTIDAAVELGLDGLIHFESLPERCRNASRTNIREILALLLDNVDQKKIHVDDYDKWSKLAKREPKPVTKAIPAPEPKPKATKLRTTPLQAGPALLVAPVPLPPAPVAPVVRAVPQTAPQFADLAGVTDFLGTDGWTKVTVERVGVFAGKPLFTVKA